MHCHRPLYPWIHGLPRRTPFQGSITYVLGIRRRAFARPSTWATAEGSPSRTHRGPRTAAGAAGRTRARGRARRVRRALGAAGRAGRLRRRVHDRLRRVGLAARTARRRAAVLRRDGRPGAPSGRGRRRPAHRRRRRRLRQPASTSMRTVRAYEAAGVAALHLEDQVSPKRCGHSRARSVIAAGEMVEKVRAAVEARGARRTCSSSPAPTRARSRASTPRSSAPGATATPAPTSCSSRRPRARPRSRRWRRPSRTTPLLFNAVDGGTHAAARARAPPRARLPPRPLPADRPARGDRGRPAIARAAASSGTPHDDGAALLRRLHRPRRAAGDAAPRGPLHGRARILTSRPAVRGARRRVRGGARASVFRNSSWSRWRRTSVLPRPDVGRPTFDGAPRRRVLPNAREVRRDSAPGAAGPGRRCPAQRSQEHRQRRPAPEDDRRRRDRRTLLPPRCGSKRGAAHQARRGRPTTAPRRGVA